MLMAAYGWTLEDAMDLTYPQMRLFFRAIEKFPPVNIIAPAILKVMGLETSKKKDETLGQLSAVGDTIIGQDAAAIIQNLKGQA